MNLDIKIKRKLNALAERHQRIDGEIAQESKRPAPDGAILQTLKKQRLAAKDQLYRLKTKQRMQPAN